ncbi:putative addiction module antidote protein [soil metagenome]
MTDAVAAKRLKVRPFDAAEHLQDEGDVAEYLNIVLEDGDSALLAAALGDIARARGMSALAAQTGLSRESLYRGLSGDRVPSADTLLNVIRGLGFRLKLEPLA